MENVSRSNCPVCLDDIHTSRIPCHIPDCGHLLHRTCFEELVIALIIVQYTSKNMFNHDCFIALLWPLCLSNMSDINDGYEAVMGVSGF